MKLWKKAASATKSKPQKVLLHMAQNDDGWAGKAIYFDRDEEFNFASLEELVDWLNRRRAQ